MAGGDGFESCLEVAVRIDVVQLNRFDQRGDAGPDRGTLNQARTRGSYTTSGDATSGGPTLWARPRVTDLQ